MAQPPFQQNAMSGQTGMGQRPLMAPAYSQVSPQYNQGMMQQQQQQQTQPQQAQQSQQMGPPMNPGGNAMGPPQPSQPSMGMGPPAVGNQQASGFPAPSGAAPPMGSPTKEVNTASLCRIGLEFVQDTVQKTTDIFALLRSMQLPNGANVSASTFSERKVKLDESVQHLVLNFKRLRLVYDKVNENTGGLYTKPTEDMLPIEDGSAMDFEDMKPFPTDTVKFVSDEHRELVDQLRVKNLHLKEIIDQLRLIIWEVNTMIAMRRT